MILLNLNLVATFCFSLTAFSSMTVAQTTTPLLSFYSHHDQWKASLVESMVGKKLNELRTPSLVIDREILKRNCNKLACIKSDLNTKVRVHVKTHKVL